MVQINPGIIFKFSPVWFQGIDSIFDIFGVVVPFLIALYAYKMYRFSGEKNHKLFMQSFFAISLSFIFKILTNITIYEEFIAQKTIGFVTFSYPMRIQYDYFYFLGYFLSRFLFLIGIFGVYLLLYHSKERYHKYLIAYFLFIVAFVSHYFFHIFHLTAALLLIYVSYGYLMLYKKSKKPMSKNLRNIFAAFVLLLLSQLTFIPVHIFPGLYVFGETIQLAGFLTLLLGYVIVLRK